MKKPELTGVAWLGPKEEMDRASHRVGKCSWCLEIICVEKAVTDTQNTQPETNEMLYKAFRAHVKLKHSEDFSQPPRFKTAPLPHEPCDLLMQIAVSPVENCWQNGDFARTCVPVARARRRTSCEMFA